MSIATQQFYELVAARFWELEEAKLERAEILLNMRIAFERGEMTQEQYTELQIQAAKFANLYGREIQL